MLVVCCVFSHSEDDDHSGRRGNTARALTQWRRFVTSGEATDALHQAMFIALYRPGSMVIEITIKFVSFFEIVNNCVARKKIFLHHFYDLAKLL